MRIGTSQRFALAVAILGITIITREITNGQWIDYEALACDVSVLKLPLSNDELRLRMRGFFLDVVRSVASANVAREAQSCLSC